MSEYRKPAMAYLSAREAPDLYEREEELHTALESVARELSRLFGFTRKQLFTHAIPEAPACLLEAYDEGASIIAAEAYLESKGFKVSAPCRCETGGQK